MRRFILSRPSRNNLRPQGVKGIQLLGHREYVGGLWEEVGKLQFDFLIAQGLKPNDILIDVACGSLRAGRLLIPYLDEGNYLGVDKEPLLIQRGVAHELPQGLIDAKRPQLVASSNFDFAQFSKDPTFGIAQSLFTHLPAPLIQLCMSRLRDKAAPGCRFFATYTQCETPIDNPSRPHDHGSFSYTLHEMRAFGEERGWSFRYIGDWQHPRGQVMAEYIAS